MIYFFTQTIRVAAGGRNLCSCTVGRMADVGKATRKRIAWRYLDATFSTMQEGKEFLKAYSQAGLNLARAWKRCPGGEGQTRAIFQCDGHHDCPVKIRLNGNAGFIKLEGNGEVHSAEEKVFDRKNAALTMEEKAEVASGSKYGASASKIFTEFTLSASKEKDEDKGRKREGGNEAGVEGMLIILCHNTSFTIIMPHIYDAPARPYEAE